MTTNLSCTGCIHLRGYREGKWCSANNNSQDSVYRLISVEKQRSDAGRCGPERVLYKQDLFGRFFFTASKVKEYKMSQPYAIAIAMMALISQALSSKEALPPFHYCSRGYGRGVYSGKGRGNPSGKVYPFSSGRECDRRMKQMEAGKLAWNKSGCW